MPALDTFRNEPLELYIGTANRRTLKLYRDNQTTPEALPDGAILRFKLAAQWGDETPLLDIDSVGPTDNGSVITIVSSDAPAEASMLIVADDLEDIPEGKYVGMVGWVDPNDDDRWKLIERGEVLVSLTLGGDTGTT